VGSIAQRPRRHPELDDQRAAIRASDWAVGAAAPNRKLRGHHAERLESAGKARFEPHSFGMPGLEGARLAMATHKRGDLCAATRMAVRLTGVRLCR
jgi:hypothetical protein